MAGRVTGIFTTFRGRWAESDTALPEVLCKQCGTAFTPTRSDRRKFCSPVCSAKWRKISNRRPSSLKVITPGLTAEQRRANFDSTERMPWPEDYKPTPVELPKYRRPKQAELVCSHCRESDIPRRMPRGKYAYCSKKCRIAARTLEAVRRKTYLKRGIAAPDEVVHTRYVPRTAPRRIIACQRCGTPFESLVRLERKYCSRECAQFARPRAPRRICQHCGADYSTAQLVGGFCSRECARIAHRKLCVVCGVAFDPTRPTHLYCSRACQGKVRSTDAWRAAHNARMCATNAERRMRHNDGHVCVWVGQGRDRRKCNVCGKTRMTRLLKKETNNVRTTT